MPSVPAFLDLSRSILRQALRNGDPAVDATLGNGRDAALLAELVGPRGRVFCFDIQELAIRRAAARLAQAGLSERVELFHAGHETLAERLPKACLGRVRAATFNLGFLPGSDRAVITRPETTLAALEALAPFMAEGGVISVAVYAGHPGGEAEQRAVEAWCAALEPERWFAARYGQVNKRSHGETLFLLERLDAEPGAHDRG